MTTGENPRMIDSETPHAEGFEIGEDQWVAQYDRRLQRAAGLWGRIARRWLDLPLYARMGVLALIVIIWPMLTGLPSVLTLLNISNNNFLIRIGTQFLAFSILAIGLNVVVGYAGLLDLGYVAFFGLSGYAYAYLSSDFIGGGVHIPSVISIPLIIAFTALIGWLIGSTSIRLEGDYLAIVTLGFGQLFVQLGLTLTRVKLFWLDRTVDLTHGPNGINKLDNISFFGFTFDTSVEYYYLFFFMLIITFVVIDRINASRIGRAWRAMSEDELATEVMGMPTRRLKLLAFAIGATVAAFAGTVFAAWQGNVVPEPRYSVLTLINLYAMVVLGGLGSLPGVIMGALVFTALPEALRNVELAGYLFYIGGLVGLLAWLKPSRRFVGVVGGAIVGGLVLKAALNALAPGLDSGIVPTQGSALNQLIQGWLVIPQEFESIGNIAIGLGVLGLLLSLLLKSTWRWVFLTLALYMFAFAWETRLADEANFTRVLIVGAALVVLMITRPQGLLGKLRVQIV